MILEILNVKKTYQQAAKQIEIFRELNFSIKSEKNIAILGRSGSGKSTLLSLLAGLDKVDAGSIYCFGTDLGRLNESELSAWRSKNLGVIFQQYHLINSLNALENVMLPLEILQQANAREKALEMLDKVGLSERIHHFPSQLSGGEAQRVAIARAFVAEPKLLLADEPSGNLDVETGQKVMQLLLSLSQTKKTTLILVTHDLELAKKCAEVYELKDGMLKLHQ
ncbi:MAG: ABC transporter ATP-binding protein [Bacteriovoracaceae bacterium]|nr:ABC transporter ATP-binding protein [Bacteriovoracaceae bacterium]